MPAPDGESMRVVPKERWDLHEELNVRPFDGDFPPRTSRLEQLRRDGDVYAPVAMGDATYALDPDRVLDALEYLGDADCELWLPNEEDAVYVVEASSGAGGPRDDGPGDVYVLIAPMVGGEGRRLADDRPAAVVEDRGTGGIRMLNGAVVAALGAAAWWLLTAVPAGTICLDAPVTAGCLVPAGTVALVVAAAGAAWFLLGLVRHLR